MARKYTSTGLTSHIVPTACPSTTNVGLVHLPADPLGVGVAPLIEGRRLAGIDLDARQHEVPSLVAQHRDDLLVQRLVPYGLVVRAGCMSGKYTTPGVAN